MRKFPYNYNALVYTVLYYNALATQIDMLNRSTTQEKRREEKKRREEHAEVLARMSSGDTNRYAQPLKAQLR